MHAHFLNTYVDERLLPRSWRHLKCQNQSLWPHACPMSLPGTVGNFGDVAIKLQMVASQFHKRTVALLLHTIMRQGTWCVTTTFTRIPAAWASCSMLLYICTHTYTHTTCHHALSEHSDDPTYTRRACRASQMSCCSQQAAVRLA